jgi:DNA-directed RNA polymerase subunit RPC12/RpoP
MPEVTHPDKRDVIRSIIYISLYVIVIGAGAFLLLPDLWYAWYAWFAIVLAGMLILVNWHKQKTAYRCPNCDHLYEISFLTDLTAPHGLDRAGGWLLLRCPNCRQRRKTTVLKKVD